MNFDASIDALVTNVENQWAAVDHNRAAFPAIAVAAIEQAAIHNKVTLQDLLSYLAEQPSFPKQVDPSSAFGETPITLRFRERFAVDLYFWHRPVVTIHNHSFSGAFSVLVGVSLHTLYSFIESKRFGDRVMIGEVAQDDVELLQRGAVREIVGSVAHVHQVAHLSRPCVSLVIRTHPDPSDPPIYTFLPPSFAMLESRSLSESEQKQLALVDLFCRTPRKQADDLLLSMLLGADDLLVAWALRSVAEKSQDLDRARQLAARLGERPWLDAFLRSIEHTDTADVNLRMVSGEGPRLFVMLLKNADDRETRDRIASEYRPGQSFTDAVVAWTAELSRAGFFGMPLPEVAIIALHSFVEGANDEATCREIAAHYGRSADGLLETVQQMREFFNTTALYRQLLQSP